MAGEDDATTSNNTKTKDTLHQAYTVTNINTKIRTLDGIKVTYSAWVRLFEIQVNAFKVRDHIDGTEPPDVTAANYAKWSSIDSLVLQWIHSTLSDELFARVVAGKHMTARSAWTHVQSIFLNNKNARAAALTHAFSNLQLTSCASLDAYCQKLQDLANQLADVDHPVTESGLVLQLVRGLPKEYEVVGSLINQQNPSWDVARNMLDLELQRQKHVNPPPTVLVTPTGHQANSSNSSNHNTYKPTGYQGKNYDPHYHANRGRGSAYRGRGGCTANRGGRGGRGGYPLQQQNWHSHNGSWATPPSPYPTAQHPWHGPQQQGPSGPRWPPSHAAQQQFNYAATMAPSKTQIQHLAHSLVMQTMVLMN